MTEEKKKKPPKTLLGIFDIIPEDMDEIDALMENVVKPAVEKMNSVVETYKIQPIAFGAKKIIARLIFKEIVGGTQPLEDAITNLEEIQRAECSMVTIIS
jgi:translation elongation factor EF-1beta